MINLQKDASGKFRHKITIGAHNIYVDASTEFGGDSSAPDPHDLFDASLAACKAITLSMYAQRKDIPLDGVNIVIARNAAQEKKGEYQLVVTLHLVGDLLTIEQKQLLLSVADKCPIHKLMTQATINVVTTLG